MFASVNTNEPTANSSLQRAVTWLQTKPTPGIVEEFVSRHYVRDPFVQVAERARALIEKELAEPGVKDQLQAKVACRAKTKESLRQKLKGRHADKNYQDVADIWSDDGLYDLAGVRITLYTSNPDQRERARRIIEKIWEGNVKAKFHGDHDSQEKSGDYQNKPMETVAQKGCQTPTPSNDLNKKTKYKPRHLGYHADHYRVDMTTNHELPPNYEWVDYDRVEIQVTSAFAHAWAEAGHDVLYKSSLFGAPTEQEERILDAVSGLVSSGDLLLEQFRELLHKRTYANIQHRDEFGTFLRSVDVIATSPYNSHFCAEESMEGVDLVFRVLVKTDQHRPITVRNALSDIGYPDNPEPQLKGCLNQLNIRFAIRNGLVASLCLIHRLLLERPLTEDRPNREYQPSKKLYLMMNALKLLQLFADRPDSAREYLREALSEPERQSMNYVLSDGGRFTYLTMNDREEDEKVGPALKAAWRWFEGEAGRRDSLCGLFLRIAEMGATKDVEPYTLLRELSIGSLLESSSQKFNDWGGDLETSDSGDDSEAENTLLETSV